MEFNKPVLGVAAVVIVIGVSSWYYFHSRHARVAESPMVAAPLEVPQSSPAEPAIQHPVPLPQTSSTSTTPVVLPALADSDVPLHEALVEAAGAPDIADFLRPENTIRHIVVTIDNLARSKVALDKRAVGAVPGSFLVDGDELHATLDEQNFQRYRLLVDALKKVDIRRLVAVYLKFYPLFQGAYQDLGYPNGYFNDRLVQVIDVLLATPQLSGPIDLIRPNVLYVFADPTLEARPEGQKLLLRMGPENAALVKFKLMELRAAVTAAPLKH